MYAKLINITGLCIDIVMWKFTPAQNRGTFLYQEAEYVQMAKQDKRKESVINWRMALLGIGFALQLVAAFIE